MEVYKELEVKFHSFILGTKWRCQSYGNSNGPRAYLDVIAKEMNSTSGGHQTSVV
jgi:hypothetical protein